MSAELSIVLLNTVILIIAYVSVYPKLAGKDLNKVAILDGVTMSLALFIVAMKYWEADVIFDLWRMELNWFWFTFISYSLIEIPIALWYFKDNFSNNRKGR